MAIVFDFDEAELKDRGPLAEIPVRLQIAGVDLLPDIRIETWEIGYWGLAHLREAKATGKFSYEPDEIGTGLLFVSTGEDVIVHSLFTEGTVRVPYRKLVEAWEDLSNRARNVVRSLSSLPPVFLQDTVPARWLAGTPPGGTSWLAATEDDFVDHAKCFERIDGTEE